METKRSFKIEFEYLKEHFNAAVSLIHYPNGYSVYKLILKTQKFWLLSNEDEWKFFGDINLCQKLKDIIISKIKQSDRSDSNNRLNQMYKV